MLAAYAVHVEHSRGRRFPEPPHPYRNDFQRDRDRVIHARAFRRLEAKTQVFTRRYSDHFRNRLTHTLEVSQVSRTIAGALGLNVDLAEALALVHDIGHPPFGHAGEKALNAAMHEHGLIFDHNLHALRIVEDFEQRYAAFRGLNLTFEVREGIIKHSHDYDAKEHPELAEYLLDQRPPLEAQLIDLTDEIAYNTADLDDGYEAHLLSLEEIREGVPVFERFYREVEQLYPDAPHKLKFNEALKRVLNLLRRRPDHQHARPPASGRNSNARRRPQSSRPPRRLQPRGRSRTQAKQRISSTKISISVQPWPEKKTTPNASSANSSPSGWTIPNTLPTTTRKKPKEDSLPRVVCDYIAGMTDNFIFEQYEKHCAN